VCEPLPPIASSAAVDTVDHSAVDKEELVVEVELVLEEELVNEPELVLEGSLVR
jgi:hypothetical protein